MNFISTRRDFKHNLKSGSIISIALILVLSAACSSEDVDQSNPGNLDDNSSTSEIVQAEEIQPPTQTASIASKEAPDFSLSSIQGHTFTRSDFEDDKIILLVFYRAFWWAACKRQLVELQKQKQVFDIKNVQILAISTDDMTGSLALASKTDIEFPLLFTSQDSAVPDSYGVFNLFGDGLASASMFLIDKKGEIVWKSIGEKTGHFVSAEKVLKQIDSRN